MKYQLTSTNNYSDMAYGIAFICFGIFCLFILEQDTDDSGRWTLQVQVPDPFSSLFVVMDYSCYFNTYGTEVCWIFVLGKSLFSEWQETNYNMNVSIDQLSKI
ncbi:unnamed protein product [Rotaria magnacalcarata]